MEKKLKNSAIQESSSSYNTSNSIISKSNNKELFKKTTYKNINKIFSKTDKIKIRFRNKILNEEIKNETLNNSNSNFTNSESNYKIIKLSY
jgi:hypothetical protein